MPAAVELDLADDRYAICRLAPDADWPTWAAGALLSVTRTPAELSVVCRSEAVPDQVQRVGPYRLLGVRGPLPFELTGVLASLAGPLAEAEVPIFVLSTYDTDWLLIAEAELDRAIDTLREVGHTVYRPDGC